MTNQDLMDYYSGLLILQYRGKPKAYATIQALAKMVVMNQLPDKIQNGFSIEGAQGVQLDVIGKYVGASRNGYDFNGPVTLDDDDFRTLIRLSILRNSFGSSLADIQNLLSVFFNGTIRVFDHLDMRMSYYFSTAAGSSTLAQFFVKQKLLPKPMGVQLALLTYVVNIDNFFGFRTYKYPGFKNHGFNTYSNYDLDAPWLSYANAVTP